MGDPGSAPSQERTLSPRPTPEREEVRRGRSPRWGGHMVYCDGKLRPSLARPVDGMLQDGQWEQGVVVRTGNALRRLGSRLETIPTAISPRPFLPFLLAQVCSGFPTSTQLF